MAVNKNTENLVYKVQVDIEQATSQFARLRQAANNVQGELQNLKTDPFDFSRAMLDLKTTKGYLNDIRTAIDFLENKKPINFNGQVIDARSTKADVDAVRTALRSLEEAAEKTLSALNKGSFKNQAIDQATAKIKELQRAFESGDVKQSSFYRYRKEIDKMNDVLDSFGKKKMKNPFAETSFPQYEKEVTGYYDKLAAAQKNYNALIDKATENRQKGKVLSQSAWEQERANIEKAQKALNEFNKSDIKETLKRQSPYTEGTWADYVKNVHADTAGTRETIEKNINESKQARLAKQEADLRNEERIAQAVKARAAEEQKLNELKSNEQAKSSRQANDEAIKKAEEEQKARSAAIKQSMEERQKAEEFKANEQAKYARQAADEDHRRAEAERKAASDAIREGMEQRQKLADLKANEQAKYNRQANDEAIRKQEQESKEFSAALKQRMEAQRQEDIQLEKLIQKYKRLKRAIDDTYASGNKMSRGTFENRADEEAKIIRDLAKIDAAYGSQLKANYSMGYDAYNNAQRFKDLENQRQIAKVTRQREAAEDAHLLQQARQRLQAQRQYQAALDRANLTISRGNQLNETQYNILRRKTNEAEAMVEALNGVKAGENPFNSPQFSTFGNFNRTMAEMNAKNWSKEGPESYAEAISRVSKQQEILYRQMKQDPTAHNVAAMMSARGELARLTEEQRRYAMAVQSSTSYSEEFYRKLRSHAQWIVAGGLIGVVAGVPTLMINQMTELEQKMASIRQVVPAIEGLHGDNFLGSVATQNNRATESMEHFISIAGRYGASVEETMEAARSIGRMYGQGDGKDPDSGIRNTELFTKQAARMAVADAFSMTDATRGLEAALSQFNLQTEDTAQLLVNTNRVLDTWTKTSHRGAASAQDIGQAIEVAGTAAAQAGVSFEFFNVLVETGVRTTARSGNEIGQAVKSMMVSMQTDKSIKALKEWGIEVTEIGKDGQRHMKNMEKIILEVSALVNSTEKDTSKLLSTLSGGKYQYSKVSAMLKNRKELLRMLAELNKPDTVGFTGEQINVQLDTLSRQLQRLKADFTQLTMDAANNGGISFFKSIVQYLDNVAVGLHKVDKTWISTMGNVAKYAAIFVVIKKGLGGLISAFTQWRITMAAMQASGGAFGGIFTGLQNWKERQQLKGAQNAGRKGYVVGEAANTAAESANTGAIQANTAANSANTAARGGNTAAVTANTGAEAANTRAKQANTAANTAEAGAATVAAAAQRKSGEAAKQAGTNLVVAGNAAGAAGRNMQSAGSILTRIKGVFSRLGTSIVGVLGSFRSFSGVMALVRGAGAGLVGMLGRAAAAFFGLSSPIGWVITGLLTLGPLFLDYAADVGEAERAADNFNDKIQEQNALAQEIVEQGNRQAETVQTLAEQYNDIKDSMAKCVEGSDEYKKKSEELSEIQQALDTILGQSTEQFIENGKYKVKSIVSVAKADTSKAMQMIENNRSEILANRAATQAAYDHTLDRLKMMKNEADGVQALGGMYGWLYNIIGEVYQFAAQHLTDDTGGGLFNTFVSKMLGMPLEGLRTSLLAKSGEYYAKAGRADKVAGVESALNAALESQIRIIKNDNIALGHLDALENKIKNGNIGTGNDENLRNRGTVDEDDGDGKKGKKGKNGTGGSKGRTPRQSRTEKLANMEQPDYSNPIFAGIKKMSEDPELAKAGLTPGRLMALAMIEAGNGDGTINSGAENGQYKGMFQLGQAVRDKYLQGSWSDPLANANAAANYLHDLLIKHNGSAVSALEEFSGGAGADYWKKMVRNGKWYDDHYDWKNGVNADKLTDDGANAAQQMLQFVETGLKAGMDAWLGSTTDLHGVGCVEAVEKIGSFYSQFLADEFAAGVRYIPTLVEHAKQKGLEVIPYEEGKLGIGDSVIWKNSGDTMNHIGIFTGKGADGQLKTVDNSSGADRIMERNLYRGWQTPEYIIKTGAGSGSGLSWHGSDRKKTIKDFKVDPVAELLDDVKEKEEEYNRKKEEIKVDIERNGDNWSNQLATLLNEEMRLKSLTIADDTIHAMYEGMTQRVKDEVGKHQDWIDVLKKQNRDFSQLTKEEQRQFAQLTGDKNFAKLVKSQQDLEKQTKQSTKALKEQQLMVDKLKGTVLSPQQRADYLKNDADLDYQITVAKIEGMDNWSMRADKAKQQALIQMLHRKIAALSVSANAKSEQLYGKPIETSEEAIKARDENKKLAEQLAAKELAAGSILTDNEVHKTEIESMQRDLEALRQIKELTEAQKKQKDGIEKNLQKWNENTEQTAQKSKLMFEAQNIKDKMQANTDIIQKNVGGSVWIDRNTYDQAAAKMRALEAAAAKLKKTIMELQSLKAPTFADGQKLDKAKNDLKGINDEMKKCNQIMRDAKTIGNATTQTLKRGLKEDTLEIQKLQNQLKETTNRDLNALREKGASVFERLLVDGESFADVWKSLWQDIARFAIRQLFHVGSQGGSWVSSLLGIFGGFSGGGSIGGFAGGGAINGYADGGAVKGAGTGTSDSILAYLADKDRFIYLSNGEYVMTAEATQRIGKDNLDKLNYGKRYADGGALNPTPYIPTINSTVARKATSISRGNPNARMEQLMSEQTDVLRNIGSQEGGNGNVVVLNTRASSQEVMKALAENPRALQNILGKQKRMGFR